MTIEAADDAALVYVGPCGAAKAAVTENPKFIYRDVASRRPGQPLDLGYVDADTVITVRLLNDLSTHVLRGEAIEPSSGAQVIRLAPKLSGEDLGSVYIASYYGDGRPAPVSTACALPVLPPALEFSRRLQATLPARPAFRPTATRDPRLLAGALAAGLLGLFLTLFPTVKASLRRTRDDSVMTKRVRRRMIHRTVTIYDGADAVASGFLLSTSGAPLVATCLHVLEAGDSQATIAVSLDDATATRMGLAPNVPYAASLHASDPTRDLAILSLPVGVDVGGFGLLESPGRLPLKVFSTPLHGDTERSWRDGWREESLIGPERLREIVRREDSRFEQLSVDVLQLNLTALRGASGAPVCEVGGRLIAMIVAVAERGNMAYAVPASQLDGWEQRVASVGADQPGIPPTTT